jgi:hypothetical protein
MTDANNCGTCGTACGPTQRCVAGACMAGPSGHYAMGVSSMTFVDACGLPGALRLMRGIDDGVTAPLASPFPFLFYGAPYNILYQSLSWGAHSAAFDIGAQDALAQRALLIEYGNAPLTTVTTGTRIHLTWIP